MGERGVSRERYLAGQLSECSSLESLDRIGDGIAALLPEGDLGQPAHRKWSLRENGSAYLRLCDLWARRRRELEEGM